MRDHVWGDCELNRLIAVNILSYLKINHFDQSSPRFNHLGIFHQSFVKHSKMGTWSYSGSRLYSATAIKKNPVTDLSTQRPNSVHQISKVCGGSKGHDIISSLICRGVSSLPA